MSRCMNMLINFTITFMELCHLMLTFMEMACRKNSSSCFWKCWLELCMESLLPLWTSWFSNTGTIQELFIWLKLRSKNNPLNFSIDNKFGHTQKPEDLCGENFHVDHHLYHMKNFGIYNCLMDMYFETSVNNDKYMIKPSLYHPGEKEIVFNVEKKVGEDSIVFHFTPKAWNT